MALEEVDDEAPAAPAPGFTEAAHPKPPRRSAMGTGEEDPASDAYTAGGRGSTLPVDDAGGGMAPARRVTQPDRGGRPGKGGGVPPFIPLTAAGGHFLNDLVSAVDAWAPIPGLEPPPSANDPSVLAHNAAAGRQFPAELFPEVPPELRFPGAGRRRRAGSSGDDGETDPVERRERRRRAKILLILLVFHDILLCVAAVWWSAHSDAFTWLFGSDAGEYNSKPFKKAVVDASWSPGAVPGVNVTAVRYYAGFTRGDRLVVAPPSPLGVAALGLHGATGEAVMAVDGATVGGNQRTKHASTHRSRRPRSERPSDPRIGRWTARLRRDPSSFVRAACVSTRGPPRRSTPRRRARATARFSEWARR